MINNNKLIFNGVVIETLPNTNFRVKLDDGRNILAHLSGKMRLHFIRVLVGDKVEIEVSVDGKRGRIIKRF